MSKKVVSIGEALIDFISNEIGSLENVQIFLKKAGGAPANFAVGLARLGVNVMFIGKVGKDAFGDFLRSTLNTEGIDTSLLFQTNDFTQTALGFVSLDERGDRKFLFYRKNAADTKLTPEEINSYSFTDVKFLHFGTISLLTNPSRNATFEAIKKCKLAGGKICFDPNLRLDLWKREKTLRKMLHEALLSTDIFYPSKDELSFIIGNELDEKEAIIKLMDLYPIGIIALKLGNEGCLLKERNGFFKKIPSFDVPVIDTTGAGDGFNVGFIFGLMNDCSIEEAGIFGNAIGALVIQKKGAMSSLPTLIELKEFLRKQNVHFSILQSI